jgi:hypothetical protein
MYRRKYTAVLRLLLGVAVTAFFAYSFYRRGVDGTFDFMMREECVLPALSGTILYAWLHFGPRWTKEGSRQSLL